MESTTKRITPPVYAKRLGVDPVKVVAWIRSGELRAINIATRATGRPRYVLQEEDIEAFEERRSSKPEKKYPRHRRVTTEEIIKFF